MARTTGTIHRLLVVGDDEESRMRTARAFSDLGYDVIGRSAVGQEAMDAAGRLRPDLVVVSARRPGAEDALAVARGIEEIYDIPSLHVGANVHGRDLGHALPSAPYDLLRTAGGSRETRPSGELAVGPSSQRGGVADSNGALADFPFRASELQRLEAYADGPASGAETSARLLERLRRGDAVVSEKLHLQMKQGTEVVVLVCTDIVGPDGEESRWIGRRRMTTMARAHAAPDLTGLAFQDPLTGLANRRAVEEHGTRYVALAERHDAHLGVIFLDLGRFKAINDRFGHPAGDAVLIEVARRLEAGAREADVVARLGGDEFLILLPDVADLGDVVTVAHRMEREMVSPIAVEETEISIRAEMGIALYPDHGSCLEELVRAADRAMYHAKENRGELDDRPVSVLAAESAPDPNASLGGRGNGTGGGTGPSQAV